MNIVVLDGFTLNSGDLSWSGLERLGNLTVYDRTPQDMLLERARDADIVLTNKTRLDSDILQLLPKLRYIGVLATGYDVVDVTAAAERGILVTNVPAYSTESVAQFVFALLLELCLQVGLHSQSVRNGHWAGNADFSYRLSPLVELSGKTMGIVGLGRIGLQTARIASAFGMNVVAYSPRMNRLPSPDGVSWAGWEELLRTADVVSLHCPLTPQTEGLIDRAALSLMKPAAFLINTSRGKLIVEQHLADALNEGRIAGAGLDVLAVEPPSSDSVLVRANNCIITPHLAWASQEARTRLLRSAVENVEAFLAGRSVNVVNDN